MIQIRIPANRADGLDSIEGILTIKRAVTEECEGTRAVEDGCRRSRGGTPAGRLREETIARRVDLAF